MAQPRAGGPSPGACLELLAGLGRRRSGGAPPPPGEARRAAEAVWPRPLAGRAARALADPYLALTMLWRTLGRGFRGNPLHQRPRDRESPELARDLMAFLELHLRVREALPGLVAWPAGGQSAEGLQGDGGWCDLCGQCCCHCGTVPTPPAGVDYPPFFHHALAGEPLWPQPFCPFLFQALGAPRFFCGLHPVKPLACRRFDRDDCQRGRPGRGYRGFASPEATVL